MQLIPINTVNIRLYIQKIDGCLLKLIYKLQPKRRSAMYHPSERFAKAYQEELMREAYPEPKEGRSFFSRLFSGFLSAREEAPQPKARARETRNVASGNRPVHNRG
jgi:hypothetical protein